jgi:predicted lipid-binding transport protein (Tim44 family)
MAFVLLVGAGAWHFMGAVAAAMVFVACVLLVARKAWLARRRSNRSRTLQAGSGQPASDMATPLASHAADASLAPRDEPAFTPPPPTHQGQPQDVVGEQPGDTQSTGALNPAALPAGEKGATTAPPEPISDSVDAKPRDVSGSAERPHDKDAK